MKIKRYLLVFFLLGIWMLLPVSISFGQTPPPPLPSDIVFGANAGNSLEYLQAGPFVLTLLNSHNMEFVELYRSDHNVPVPLSWSPEGDLLTFALKSDRGMDEGEPMEVCILTVTGVLQTCFEDQMIYFPSYIEDTVTWSSDGTTVYFVTRREQTWQLIAADVVTGQTLDVLFETPFVADAWRTSKPTRWSSNLRYVELELGSPSIAVTIVDLETGEELDIHHVLQPYMDETIQQSHDYYVCPGFSPSRNYLAALIPITRLGNSTEIATNRMVIFDPQGNIVQIFEPTGSVVSCPVWAEDERYFYFTRYNPQEGWSGIFTYTLENERLHAQAMDIDSFMAPFVLSPDGVHLALQAFTEVPQFKVLFPTGTIRSIDLPYISVENPVWRPNTE
jgi:hypothetical protein